MKSVFSELRYNLKHSVFINIVLTAQCVLAAWLFVTLISYYVDLPTMYSPENVYGEYAYYSMMRIGTDQQFAATESISQDPMYLDKLKTTIAEVKEDPRYTYIAVDFDQGFPVSNTLFEKFFRGKIPDDFFSGSAYPGYYSKPEHRVFFDRDPFTTRIFYDAINLTVCRIDENAFHHYNLQVSAGRPFEHEDYTLRADQTTIPLLLGDAYSPYFTVGDTFDVDFVYYKFTVEVIGFLSPHSDLVSDQFLPIDGYPVSLDYAMIYPFFNQIDRNFTTWEEREFGIMNFEGYLYGTLVTDADLSRSQVTQIEKDLGDLYLKNGLFQLHLLSSPDGVYTFQMETQKSVSIMTSMMIVVLIFNLFCIFFSLATKIQRNLKRYATELMLGQSLYSIWVAYLSEIMLLSVFALLTTAIILFESITMNVNFLWLMFGFFISVTLISSLGILWKLRGIDIEALIRRAE